MEWVKIVMIKWHKVHSDLNVTTVRLRAGCNLKSYIKWWSKQHKPAQPTSWLITIEGYCTWKQLIPRLSSYMKGTSQGWDPCGSWSTETDTKWIQKVHNANLPQILMLKDVSFIQQIQEFLQHIIMGPFLLQNRPDWFYGPISLLFYGVPSWG